MSLRIDLIYEFLQEAYETSEDVDDKEFIQAVPKIKFLPDGNIEIGDEDFDSQYFENENSINNNNANNIDCERNNFLNDINEDQFKISSRNKKSIMNNYQYCSNLDNNSIDKNQK